jgi:hypothetical protein
VTDRHERAPCSICGELPERLVANTGRDERFPDAVYRLTHLDLNSDFDLARCPECDAWFEWEDERAFTGSGNNDEARLRRLAPEAAAALRELVDGKFEPGEEAGLLAIASAGVLESVARAVRRRLSR